MLGKIQKAVSDMKAATTLEAAQTTFNAIEDEVVATSNRNDEKFAELVNEVKTAREEQKQLLEELFAKYKEILQTIEGTDANDMEILDTLIAQARKESNNAKTANDVKNAQAKFEKLMDSELKQKVDNQTKLLKAQMDANDEMDTYKDVLDAMTDLTESERSVIEDQIATVKEQIKNAKNIENIDEALESIEQALVNFGTFMEGHAEVNAKAEKALLDRAVEKAIEKLETYKTGAYANEMDPVDEEKTIKELVDEYIEQINNAAEEKNAKASNIEEKLNEILNGNDPVTADGLDEKIETIKQNIEDNYENYINAYNVALEELNLYAKNAKVKLTGDELAYVNSLIESTKGKLSNVQTEAAVEKAMTVFRNAVTQYSSEFDEYQIEEIRKVAISELESYKELNDDEINTAVDEGLSNVKTGKTVGDIQTALKNAEDAINKIISKNEVLQAIANVRTEFTKYLEDDEKYTTELKAIASQALKELQTIDKEEGKVEEVDFIAEKYRKEIKAQLEKDGQLKQEEIKEARETAKETLALYKELATLSEDTSLLTTIGIYEKNIDSENATAESIEKDLNELLKSNIEIYHPLVNAKLVAITTINTIGGEDSFCNKTEYAHLTKTKLTDYTEIKDAVNDVISKIKNVKKSDDAVTKVNALLDKATKKSDGELIVLVTEMNELEEKRANAISELKGKDTKNIATSIIEEYTDKINAITLKEYKEKKTLDVPDKVFKDILTAADSALKSYKSGLDAKVKEAKNSTENVENVNNKIGSQAVKFGTELSKLQSELSVTNGKVSGTLLKQEKYEEAYGKNSEGWYMCLRFECPEASKIEVTRSGAGATESITRTIEYGTDEWDNGVLDVIVQIKDKNQIDNFKIEYKYYGWDDDGKQPIITGNITLDKDNLEFRE